MMTAGMKTMKKMTSFSPNLPFLSMGEVFYSGQFYCTIETGNWLVLILLCLGKNASFLSSKLAWKSWILRFLALDFL